MSQKTIIDILNKGNIEQFHSAMLAWLLNPNGEHNLNDQVLRPVLEKANVSPEKFLDCPEIRTEKKGKGSRYDIQIKPSANSGDERVIIESKVKSVGENTQLNKYNQAKNHLMLYGPLDISFPPDSQIPLLTYDDLTSILGDVKLGQNSFSYLVSHYRDYLEREKAFLTSAMQYGKTGNEEFLEKLHTLKQDSIENENDKRFLDLAFLEKFNRERLNNRGHTGKNVNSGTFLAFYNNNQQPEFYNFHNKILNILDLYKPSWLWYQIDLTKGLLTKKGKIAGEIQLRAACPHSENKKFFNEITKTINNFDNNNLIKPKKPANNYKTFTLIKKNIYSDDLPFNQLDAAINEFRVNFEKL